MKPTVWTGLLEFCLALAICVAVTVVRQPHPAPDPAPVPYVAPVHAGLVLHPKEDDR